jgi:hypothetical protein
LNWFELDLIPVGGFLIGGLGSFLPRTLIRTREKIKKVKICENFSGQRGQHRRPGNYLPQENRKKRRANTEWEKAGKGGEKREKMGKAK